MVRVAVLVRGGLVQSVYTDTPEEVSIEVFDLDESDFSTEKERADLKKRGEEFDEAIKLMDAVY